MKLTLGLAVLLFGALAATGCTLPYTAKQQCCVPTAPTVEHGNVQEVWKHLLPPGPQDV